MTQPLVSEPCDTPDRVTIFMDVTDRPYFGRFLTTIADADERRTTTRRYRRRHRSNGRSRTYPVTTWQGQEPWWRRLRRGPSLWGMATPRVACGLFLGRLVPDPPSHRRLK